MKNEYNPFENHSLLYIIVSELVFLHETKRIIDSLANQLKLVYNKTRTGYKNLLKNQWVEASIMLSGLMTVSTLILLVAYKLVMIF